jgi:hypothetical protein
MANGAWAAAGCIVSAAAHDIAAAAASETVRLFMGSRFRPTWEREDIARRHAMRGT